MTDFTFGMIQSLITNAGCIILRLWHILKAYLFFTGVMKNKMEFLNIGMCGPFVSMLQLALARGGFFDAEPDGRFCELTQSALRVFQTVSALEPSGVAGPKTWKALSPYLTGFMTARVKRGENLASLSRRFGTTEEAVAAANGITKSSALRQGSRVVVPLGFPVVPVNIPYSHALVSFCVSGLAARYPFLRLGKCGFSVMGRPIHVLKLGHGGNEVFFNAAHHASEWITTPLLLKFIENLSIEVAFEILSTGSSPLLEKTTLYTAPMVNPDGVDLVNGALPGTSHSRAGALKIAAEYPETPFPSGWKANIRGIDLNLQYPAGFEQARKIKAELGVASPAPSNFPGSRPLSAPESAALYRLARARKFSLALSLHTQGEVIYGKYLGKAPPHSAEIGAKLASLSGYEYADTPEASGHAGFTDWFINEYDRPAFTVEAGLGVNPLPLSQFEKIYDDNLELLKYALTATA